MKTAIITGASGGLGSLLVSHLCAMGWHVIGVSRYAPTNVVSNSFTHYPLDLNNLAELPSKLSTLSKKLPKIDALLLAHGSTSSALAQQATLNELSADMRLNFFASVLLMQSFSRNLARQGGGSIVALSSIHLSHHLTGCLSYNTSKAALEEACKCFAKEMSSLGVSVNTIRLGVVAKTGMAKHINPETQEQLVKQSLAGSTLEPLMVVKAIISLMFAHEIGVSGQVQSIGDL